MIDKAIRLNSGYHQRILQIEGPIANWFRYRENQTKNTKKGTFDLRKIGLVKSEKQEDTKMEEFSVKFKQKDKVGLDEEREIKFKSEFFISLSGKTLRHIFDQIKRFYNLISSLLKANRVDYQKLRFLSDPNITQLNLFKEDSNPETIKNMIENLDWHLNLKKVHLRGLDRTNMNKFFSAMNNSTEILLESITIESTKNSYMIEFDESINPWIISMRTFFEKESCAKLEEFHLVDVKIPDIKRVLDILRGKFMVLKKKYQKNDENEIKLPFTKLSFKKSLDNPQSQINICLKELALFFNDMSILFENKFVNVFECLDISGAECLNIQGLLLIINNFKIIRELKISATKLYLPTKSNFKEKSFCSQHQGKPTNNLPLNTYLINNVEFLKSLNYKEIKYPDEFANKKDDNHFFKTSQFSNTIFEYSKTFFNPSLNKINEPILSSLYVLDTPISTEAFSELLQFYKRFKFMRELHFTESLVNVPHENYIKLNNVLSEVRKEDEFYCENFFEVEYAYNENVK